MDRIVQNDGGYVVGSAPLKCVMDHRHSMYSLRKIIIKNQPGQPPDRGHFLPLPQIISNPNPIHHILISINIFWKLTQGARSGPRYNRPVNPEIKLPATELYHRVLPSGGGPPQKSAETDHLPVESSKVFLHRNKHSPQLPTCDSR